MKFCPFCGKPVELDESTFCMKCGSKLPALPTANSVENVSLQKEAKKPENKKLISVALVLGVLIIAIAVMLATGVFSGILS